MGWLFPFWLSSQGETNGRNEQKYGSGKIARNPLLWTGTRCKAGNADPPWRHRSRYVGLSDIAKMLDCPRAALAGKLFTPEYRSTDEALKHQITFRRGHWFETGVHQALVGYGLSPLFQLEIESRYEDVPIKAHLDFTLVTDQPHPTVRILEVKSTARPPITLSESMLCRSAGMQAIPAPELPEMLPVSHANLPNVGLW